MKKEIKTAFKQVIAFWESDKIYSTPLFAAEHCSLCKTIADCNNCPLDPCRTIKELKNMEKLLIDSYYTPDEIDGYIIKNTSILTHPGLKKKFEQLRQVMIKKLKEIYKEKSGVRYRK